jgi:PleD family two-component response regulator
MIRYSNFDISQATVLIVDDEHNLRLMLCRAMEMEGYQVLEATTGDACLALCQQQIPDIILLDAVMLGLDGFACCKQLNQYLGDRCPPILMITALSDLESVNRAFDAGAIDFVTKPIHWAVLRQRVRRILQMNRAIAELYSLREKANS